MIEVLASVRLGKTAKHNIAIFIMTQERRKLDGKIYPLVVGYLPENFQRKAEVELRDTPENREKGLKLLRERIANDDKFMGYSFDDDFLLQYLRCTKYQVRRAFSKLKAFIHLRRKISSSFTNFNFESIAVTTRNKIVTFLPYRCHEGCAIILIQLDNWIPEEFPVEHVKRMVVILLLQSLRDPMNQINGFKVIFDVKSNPIRHLRFATPSNLHLLYYGPTECSPGRFKSFHVVNNSLTFKAAWVILKYFVSDKLKRRIHFHSDPEELLNYFPPQVLPSQYGGDLKDYDMTDWLRDVMQPQKLATLGGGVHIS